MSHQPRRYDVDWPFWIKTPDTYTDKKKTTVLVPGRMFLVLKPAMVYFIKDANVHNWRDAMPGVQKKKNKKLFGKKTQKLNLLSPDLFHYVLQDGNRAHWHG